MAGGRKERQAGSGSGANVCITTVHLPTNVRVRAGVCVGRYSGSSLHGQCGMGRV